MTRIVRAELDRLEALGSVEAIAADLRARGCKGFPEEHECCVLAFRLGDLLYEQADFEAVSITPPRVTVFPTAGRGIHADLEMGPLVERFALAFDEGRFPELLAAL